VRHHRGARLGELVGDGAAVGGAYAVAGKDAIIELLLGRGELLRVLLRTGVPGALGHRAQGA
jgi:hypothetical protein